MKSKVVVCIVFILVFSSFNIVSAEEPEPDIECRGSLALGDVLGGSTQFLSFTVKNIGDPGSTLNWRIDTYPDWGIFSFSPSSGSLANDQEDTVNLELKVPNDKGVWHGGEIRVRDRDCSCHNDFIRISLTTIDPNDFIPDLSTSNENLVLEGKYSPRAVIEKEITIRNTGETYSVLNWDCSVSDSSLIRIISRGDQYLETHEEATLKLEIVASKDYETLGQGTLRIFNRNNPSDEEIFPVQIETEEDEEENYRYKFLNLFSFMIAKLKILGFYTKHLNIL